MAQPFVQFLLLEIVGVLAIPCDDVFVNHIRIIPVQFL
jgi:hypothetical protein